MGMQVAEIKLISVGEIQREGCEFWIPAYQRGYRWTENEVEQLLNDLWEFATKEKGDPFYCLQPLVVCKRDENCYEVLDGQQRLTTLYILLNALHRHFGDPQWEPKFEITYETRERSREFLQNLHNQTADKARDNPDFFHMWKAHETIMRWLENKKGEISPDTFKEVLLDEIRGVSGKKDRAPRNARFVWYEITAEERESKKEDSQEDSQGELPKVFIRLNSGKVPLTDSELIRAHLLLRTKKDEPARLEERARLLDDLRLAFEEDPFWYFISSEQYATRLDRIFELYKGAPVRDHRYSLARYFLENMKEEKVEKIWEVLQSTFAYLRYLYENDEFYNLVGWTVNLRGSPQRTQEYLRHVLEKARTAPKSSLRALLYREANRVEGIWLKLENDKEVTISKLNEKVRRLCYGEGEENVHLQRVLLLYNVLAFFPVKAWEKGEEGKVKGRFPFHLYHTQKWSLEHIHPQAPTWFRRREDAMKWLDQVIPKVEEMLRQGKGGEGKDGNVLKELKKHREELQELLSRKVPDGAFRTFVEQKLGPAAKALFDMLGEAKDVKDVHDISNIALLPRELNARLSNLPYPLKRQILLEEEEAGAFVPPRTRDVFLKVFETAPSDFLVWGPDSREKYEDHIVATLRAFLKAIEQIEKSLETEKADGS